MQSNNYQFNDHYIPMGTEYQFKISALHFGVCIVYFPGKENDSYWYRLK